MKDNAIIDDNTAISTIKYILNKCKELNKYKVIVEEQTIIRKISVLTMLEVTELIHEECPILKLAVVAKHLVNHPNSRAIISYPKLKPFKNLINNLTMFFPIFFAVATKNLFSYFDITSCNKTYILIII